MIFNKYVRRKKQLKSKYKTFKSNYKKPTQCRSHQASLGLCSIQFTKIFKKADVYFESFCLPHIPSHLMFQVSYCRLINLF